MHYFASGPDFQTSFVQLRESVRDSFKPEVVGYWDTCCSVYFQTTTGILKVVTHRNRQGMTRSQRMHGSLHVIGQRIGQF